HKEDLPFPIRDIPDDFTRFRKRTERESDIRPDLPLPEKIAVPATFDEATMPTLNMLGFNEKETAIDPDRLPYVFKGGEDEGLARLQAFLGNGDVRTPVACNDGILSPWLALGCLSAHTVYHSLKAAELKGAARLKTQ